MSRASRARHIARAAAYGGGGVGALGALGAAALWGVIAGESRLARRRIPDAVDDPPVSHDTTWAAEGVGIDHSPIRLAMLGDSTAAGYGVDRDRDTPGVQLAIAISSVARRPVHLSSVAVVGADSTSLAAQVDRLDLSHIDLAVIMIGANDVTHRLDATDAVRYLHDAVATMVAQGAAVIVGTCPDLGTIRPIAQPLRYVARRLSRNLAAAQTVAVVAAGGRTVSLGDLLGPLFARHSSMFSEDRFHPSASGYDAAAKAVLPSALDVLGLRTRVRSATPFGTRRPRPVSRVAAKAATHPGSEVAATELLGLTAGRRGPWAVLRRRRTATSVPGVPDLAREVD